MKAGVVGLSRVRAFCCTAAVLAGVGCGGADAPTDPGNDLNPITLPGVWAQVTPLPSPMAEGGAAAHGGKLYVVGGRVDPNGEGATALAFRFDPGTGAWERLPDLPDALWRPSVTEAHGDLLVVGGDGTTSGAAPRATVWRWDDGAGAWAHHSTLPVPSTEPLAAPVRDGVLVTRLGGHAFPPGDSTGFFPTGGESWRFAPPTPFAVSHLVSDGSQAWAVGLDAVGRWAPGGMAWAPLGGLPTTGALLGAWHRDGRIHVVQRVGTAVSHDVLSPAGTWSSLAPPPGSTKRLGGMSATLDGKLYLIGGIDLDTGLLSRVDVFDLPPG